jgi:hypothetical protein
MANTPSSPENFTQSISTQAWRIWEDALYCSAGHFQESRWWEGVHLWMGIPTTILAAITGITSLTDSSTTLILGINTSVVVPVLAFTVAAMSGLSTFLDPKGQATKHYQTASEYQALVNDIRLFCQIDCWKAGNEDKMEDSLRRFNARLNKLNTCPIIISKRATRIALKEIKEGKFNYQVDCKTQQPSSK